MAAWFQREFFDILRKERGVSWGRDLYLYDEVGSTNDEALNAVASGVPTGSVWLARNQKAGRGRRGNAWHAAAGESLLVSCLLRYTGRPERFLGLSLVVGLAVRQVVNSRLSSRRGLALKTGAAALDTGSAEPQIKWPNDVLVSGKKLAGVLVETRTGPSGELGTVIGVGLNLSTEEFPADLPPATSLRLLGAEDAELRLEVVLVEFLGALEKKLELFLVQGFAPFSSELAEADYLKGKPLRVGTAEGKGSGFDAQGRLLIETAEGTVPVISGTVQLLL